MSEKGQLTEQLLPHLAFLPLPVPHCRLGKLVDSHFIGNVRTAQSGAGYAKAVLNDIGIDMYVGAFDVDALHRVSHEDSARRLVGHDRKLTLIRDMALTPFATLPSSWSITPARTVPE